MQDIYEKFKKVKVFVTDFDGIHTDGYVYMDEKGKETVKCSRRDGLAFEMLKKIGIPAYIISKEKNKVIKKRAKKIGVKYYQGVDSSLGKKDILNGIVKENKVSLEEVLYMGDDINDIECIKMVGVPVTVADGHEKIIQLSCYITVSSGGNHAIREVVSILMESKGYEESI